MRNRKRLYVVGGLAAILIAVTAIGVGGVLATGGGDSDQPITGPALEEASAAALEATGGGKVTETEVGDEEGFYEVEVTLDDGTQVDVHLDENFKVIGSEQDHDTPGDQDGPNDHDENDLD